MYTICTCVKHKHMINTDHDMKTYTLVPIYDYIQNMHAYITHTSQVYIQHSRYTIDQTHIHSIYIHKHIDTHMNT